MSFQFAYENGQGQIDYEQGAIPMDTDSTD